MKLKKYFTVIMTVLLLTSSSVFSSAASVNESELNYDEIMLQNGFTQVEVELFSKDLKKDTVETLLINPNDVQIEISVTEIDELQSIETFVNTPVEVYLNAGVAQEEIDMVNDLIEGWRSSSDEELMKRYNRNQEEIKLLRMASTPDEDYVKKEFDSTIVTSSDSISASKLYFSTTATRKISSNKFYYQVTNTFEWHTFPFIDILTDKIANAWGGDMYTSNESSILTYYYRGNYSGNGNTKNYAAHYEEGPINGGFVFWTHQSQGIPSPLGNDYHQLWKGTCSIRLNQNGGVQGKTTKVIGQYGHHTIGWADVSISSSPSISFGTGWDYSEQVRCNVTY